MGDTTRVAVDVTFLRMDRKPDDPAPALAGGRNVARVAAPSVAFYRYLYGAVGGPHLWWLRRTVPDDVLADLLRSPSVMLHVLYDHGEPAGFHELDTRNWPDVNLSYFGLVPHSVGKHMGYAFLRHAVDLVWALNPRGMTVNTCTADHPRAMPTYLRAGFKHMRTVRELWDVPVSLGMAIPAHLR